MSVSTFKKAQDPGAMIPRLAEILAAWQSGTPRSQQTALGPSEVGDPCARRLALKLINPRQDTELKWAALLGLWAHAGIETALEWHNDNVYTDGPARYIVERRVTADDVVVVSADGEAGLGGKTDVYDIELDEVVDWKVVGEFSLRKYREAGHPGDQYRVQAHTYGLGWQRKGYRVKSVRIVFLPRWSNDIRDGWEWSEPFDAQVAVDAVARLTGIHADAMAAVAGALQWTDIRSAPEPFKCANFCAYFRPEQLPDIDGCPGHTRVSYAIERLAGEATTLDAVRGLWRELSGAKRLDEHARTVLSERAAELQAAMTPEERAIETLNAAGFTTERIES